MKSNEIQYILCTCNGLSCAALEPRIHSEPDNITHKLVGNLRVLQHMMYLFLKRQMSDYV